jgi:phenylacetate-coenzyme A ligase PaaK-like adenylate-forming protein
MIALTPLEPWIARKIGVSDLTRAALSDFQLQQVRETLDLIRRASPFYRRYLAQSPENIESLDDLWQFPFTTADDIRQHSHEFLCVSQSEIHRVVTLNTSGTTGAPKRIFLTAEDQELTLDFFQVGMSTFVSPGDRVLILLPGERPGSVGDLLSTALGRLAALGLKHGPVCDVSTTVERLRQESIDCIVGVPTHVLALAQAMPMFQLKSALLTTDHVPDAIKRTVESNWNCAVYNHYGMTETGLGGGVECQARRGYHLREADLYVEIVDPRTGQPLTDGEMGEIVFTTLTRRGMPLLRYRTGDLGRFIPGICPCGTILKTLDRIRNRVNGRLHLDAGMYLTLSDLDEALFSIAGISNFEASLTGNILQLTVEIIEDVSLATLHQALNAIPPIRLGVLDISITTEHGYRLLYQQQMSKRTITTS